MGITGNLQLGGGITDIKQAYTVANSGVTVTTSPYTVSDTGSVIVYVDSSGGAVTVNPIASPTEGDRLKVVDIAGSAGTYNITVTNIGVIDYNNRSIEGVYRDASWKVLEDDTELTAAEIKTSYESNSDTNAFTDAEKTQVAEIDQTAIKYAIALG